MTHKERKEALCSLFNLCHARNKTNNFRYDVIKKMEGNFDD